MTEVLDTNNMTRLNNLKAGETISTSDKQFFEAPDLKEIASKVIDQEGIELGPAAVGYYLVYPNISKKTVAKVKKCNRVLKFHSGYDYLIHISGELWDFLQGEDLKYKLMWHQILHLNPTYSAKNQKWTMKKRKPQISDYYEINDKHGNEWYKALQSTMGALQDLDPENEGQVSLF